MEYRFHLLRGDYLGSQEWDLAPDLKPDAVITGQFPGQTGLWWKVVTMSPARDGSQLVIITPAEAEADK